jgi:hypothetical protein
VDGRGKPRVVDLDAEIRIACLTGLLPHHTDSGIAGGDGYLRAFSLFFSMRSNYDVDLEGERLDGAGEVVAYGGEIADEHDGLSRAGGESTRLPREFRLTRMRLRQGQILVEPGAPPTKRPIKSEVRGVRCRFKRRLSMGAPAWRARRVFRPDLAPERKLAAESIIS